MGIMRPFLPALQGFCENQISDICKSSRKNANVWFLNNYSTDKREILCLLQERLKVSRSFLNLKEQRLVWHIEWKKAKGKLEQKEIQIQRIKKIKKLIHEYKDDKLIEFRPNEYNQGTIVDGLTLTI